METFKKSIIVWQEYVNFPQWSQIRMRAKIDTGARSSAIHAEEYEIKRLPPTTDRPLNEEMKMKLKVGPRHKPRFIWVTAPVVDYRSVKNSGGKIEERPFIETEVSIGGISFKIILSVTNREKMRFPVLLGRAFLSGKFLVDTSGKHLLKQKPKELEWGEEE